MPWIESGSDAVTTLVVVLSIFAAYKMVTKLMGVLLRLLVICSLIGLVFVLGKLISVLNFVHHAMAN